MTFGIDARLNRLLARLPETDQERWLPHLEAVDLASGQVLYAAGQVPTHGYFPTTAVVSLVYTTQNGECDEVAAVGPEGVVGVSSFMGGRPTPATAIVQRAGQALRLQASTLKSEFERSTAVMQLMLEYSSALSVQVAQTAVCNCHHLLDQRIARRLLQGLDRQRDSNLVITHEQLAGLLGVRRESVTTELVKLQKAGVIRCSRGHVLVLDRQGLERTTCECYAVVKRQFDRVASGTAASGAAPVSPAIAPAPAAAAGDLATYLQEIRDQERADLARELHDELGSLLTGARLEVASLKARLGHGSSDILQRLKHLGETINSGISFSRRVVEGLHPSSLTKLGLNASLEILAREFGRINGIAMAISLEEVDLDEAAQLTVYRLVQEALNNTSKYARATGVSVVLRDCGSNVVITVRDNGEGFDTAALETSSHGLAGMQHRVLACGGQLTVSSSPGVGTLVAAVLQKAAHGGASLSCAPSQPLATYSPKQDQYAKPQRLARCQRRNGRRAAVDFATAQQASTNAH